MSVSAATPACGATVNTSITFNESMNCASSHGVVAGANGITIDCAGYAIEGPAGSYYGIYVTGYTGVTVKNCAIQNFSSGIYATTANNRIENVTINGSTTGITLTSTDNLVTNTTITNAGTGISETGSRNLFIYSSLSSNTLDVSSTSYNSPACEVTYSSATLTSPSAFNLTAGQQCAQTLTSLDSGLCGVVSGTKTLSNSVVIDSNVGVSCWNVMSNFDTLDCNSHGIINYNHSTLDYNVYVEATSNTVKNCTLINTYDRALQYKATSFTFKDSKVYAYRAFSTASGSGAGNLIANNTLRQTFTISMDMYYGAGTFDGNDVYCPTSAGTCFFIGTGGTISNNQFLSCYSCISSLTSTNVSGNTFSGYTIAINGNVYTSYITNNTFSSGFAILFNADSNNLIERNVFSSAIVSGGSSSSTRIYNNTFTGGAYISTRDGIIENNSFTGSGTKVLLSSSNANVIVRGNNITNVSGYPIYIQGTAGALIERNTFTGSTGTYDIYVTGTASNLQLKHNTFTGTNVIGRYGLNGVTFTSLMLYNNTFTNYYSNYAIYSSATITGANITGNQFYSNIEIGGSGHNITNNTFYAGLYAKGTSSRIYNNLYIGGSSALQSTGSGTLIANETMINASTSGISVLGGSSVTIENVNVIGNGGVYGIYVGSSTGSVTMKNVTAQGVSYAIMINGINTTISSSTFNGTSYGVYANSMSVTINTTIWNSTVYGGTSDVIMTQNGGGGYFNNLTFINVTFRSTNVSFPANGCMALRPCNFFVKWPVTVNVTDAAGGALAGATVLVRGNDNTTLATLTTDANGIASDYIIEFEENITARYNKSIPATITASKELYQNGSASIDITAPTTQQLILQPNVKVSSITLMTNGERQSYFANNTNMTITVIRTQELTPQITITDPSDVDRVSAQNMTLTINDTTYTYEYNYTINGTTGWWDVTINDVTWTDRFYVGGTWNNWTSSDNQTYPFRTIIDVTEPGTNNRTLDLAEIDVTLTYQGDPASMRLVMNSSGTLVEIPFQASGNSVVETTELLFLPTLNLGETRRFWLYYARNATNTSFTEDLSLNSTTYKVENSYYRIAINSTAGGVIKSSTSTLGGGSLGSTPMMYSPVVKVSTNPDPYRATSITPTMTIVEDGLFKKVVRATGTTIYDFDITYTFYAHQPYLRMVTNITALSSGYWDYFKDGEFYLSSLFEKAAYDDGSITMMDIERQNAGAGGSVSGASWGGFYSPNGRNSFGIISLNAATPTASAETWTFTDGYSSENLITRPYVGSITAGQSIRTDKALVIWNGNEEDGGIDAIDSTLRNPLTATQGSTSTSDSTAPTITGSSLTPTSLNDTTNLTCTANATDNLIVDYITITFIGPGLSNATTTTIDATAGSTSVTLDNSLLNAGNITCIITIVDIANNTASQNLSVIVTDTTAPGVNSITTSPSSDADIDPGTTITVTANISEYTNITSVILEYKTNITQLTWNQTTMTLSSNTTYDYIYEANLSSNDERVLYYRIYREDGLGNNDTTTTDTVDIYWDYTWSHAPSDLGPHSILFSTNTTIGNINLTNDGDGPITFTFTSDWEASIHYNGTAEGVGGTSFTIANGTNTTIPVVVTSKLVARQDSLTITITTNASGTTSPTSNTTTATIVSYAGGPYIYATITDYNNSIYEKETAELSGYIKNLGNETASGVSYEWQVPIGWTTTGTLTEVIGDMNQNEITFVAINATPSSSDVSETINLTGRYTDNGSTINNTASVTINVLAIVTNTDQNDTAEETVTSGGGGGGGGGGGRGGGGGSPISLTTEEKEKLFRTTERYELVRGKDNEFTITMENPFEDEMQDVTMTVSGLLSKYLSIEPKRIPVLQPGENLTFTITVEAPSYFEEGEHQLRFDIEGVLYHEERLKNNITVKQINTIIDTRQVTLKILEMEHEEADTILTEAEKLLERMRLQGYNTDKLEQEYAQLVAAYDNENYDELGDHANIIGKTYEQATRTKAALDTLKGKIDSASNKYIETVQTERVYNLALAAFERGDYKTGQERIAEAELIYAAETKGVMPYRWYWENYRQQIIFVVVGSIILILIAGIFARRGYLDHQIKGLQNEEQVILGLIKEFQKETFEQNKRSLGEYNDALQQYELKLASAMTQQLNLENKRTHMLSFMPKTTRLEKEREQLIQRIQELQEKYIKEGTVETRIYENRMRKLSERIAEIDEQSAMIEAQKALKKG